MSKTDKFFEEHWWARWGAALVFWAVMWAAFDVAEAFVAWRDAEDRQSADETRRGAFFDIGGKGYEVNT
jgi:hypothetical protein